MTLRKKDSIMSVISGSLVDLPSPSSLSYLWNFGSLLGLFLFSQILTGLFLAIHFSGNVIISFDSIIHLIRDVNYGWFVRVLHANGASIYFMFMYIHIGRGLYYGSYRFKKTWMSGVTILLLSMAAAFLGYVLPWGQMSFWAATVITNLLSAIPYMGVMLVEWVWGGFSVGNPTLTRFFTFHFLLPFVILFMVILHLLFLHETGSGNPMGLSSSSDKISFHPYFSLKDIYGLMMFYVMFLMVCFMYPYMFMDSENFIASNPMVTPVHIQPEWYFLFAYTILRSITSSVGGVIALVVSVMMLYTFSFLFDHRFRSNYYYILGKVFMWLFLVNWMLLTWIGSCEVDTPYMEIGMLFSFLYFFMIIVLWSFYEVQDMIL